MICSDSWQGFPGPPDGPGAVAASVGGIIGAPSGRAVTADRNLLRVQNNFIGARHGVSLGGGKESSNLYKVDLSERTPRDRSAMALLLTPYFCCSRASG